MNIVISELEAHQRTDRFLRKYFKPYPEIKLSDIFAWLRKGVITVNKKKVKEDYRLMVWDSLSFDTWRMTEKIPMTSLIPKEEKRKSFSLLKIKSYIVFEDTHWIVWNKPADVVVHPWNHHTNDMTMHDIMQTYLEQTHQRPDSPTFTPSFCFRLDKDTSGILISAKTYEALQYLNAAIRERKTDKEYRARVRGEFPSYLSLTQPLFRGFADRTGKAHMFVNFEKGVDAHTEAWNIQTIQHPALWAISDVRIRLHTWRMHQIRVHLADAWFPILGDLTYGNQRTNRVLSKMTRITRQLLHCEYYGFYDPFTQTDHRFHAPLPQPFTQF
jgi:23S rRNA pseudouridine955/2504/2580 synthase